jgi:hypothetical protein
MDASYTFKRWPGSTKTYMDIDWLAPSSPSGVEELEIPPGYYLNPDETDENSITGPQKDKVLELFDDLNSPPLTQEVIESLRNPEITSQNRKVRI